MKTKPKKHPLRMLFFRQKEGKMITLKRAAVINEYNTAENEFHYLIGLNDLISFNKLEMSATSGIISLSKDEVKKEFYQAITDGDLFPVRTRTRLCDLLSHHPVFITEIDKPDEDLQLAAVKGSPWIISKINKPTPLTIKAALVQQTYDAVTLGYGRQDDEYFRLLNPKEIKSVLKMNPAAMSGIPSDIITGEMVYTFLEQLVKQNCPYLFGAFSNIPEQYKDKMYWQCLCMVNGYNIVGMSPDQREQYVSEKLINYTLDHSTSYIGIHWLYQYIPERLKTANISMKCIMHHPFCVDILPDSLKNEDFYRELLEYTALHGNNYTWFSHLDTATVSKEFFEETVLKYSITRFPEKIQPAYISKNIAVQIAMYTDISIPQSVKDKSFYDEMAKQGMINKIPTSELSNDRIALLINSGNKNLIKGIPDQFKTPDLMQFIIKNGLYNNLNVINDYLSEDIVMDAISRGIVTRFDDIPEKFQNVRTATALSKTGSKFLMIPEKYQTEDICKELLQDKDPSKYEWMYTLLHCTCPPKASIDNAIEKFADAINLKGLTRLQISKSIEKFPMNILKAPEWYFITEDKSEVKETVLTASISKPISEIDNCKQLSVFDLMGI